MADGASEDKASILDETGDHKSGGISVTMEALDIKDENLGVSGNRVGTGPGIDLVDDASPSSGNLSAGRAGRIRERLEREICLLELEVEDVSYQHAGHDGVRGISDGETHFNVRVVSKEFEGKSLIKRHRLVYELLQEELRTGLHALSIVAKTPSEVNRK